MESLYRQLIDAASVHANLRQNWDAAFTDKPPGAVEPGEVFKPHIGGDKFVVKSGHNYTEVYAKVLAAYPPNIHLLEIGVFRGDSLAVWSKVLPHARITGVDGNVRPFVENLKNLYRKGAFRTHIPHVISQSSTRTAPAIENRSVDIIIDDGGHTLTSQLNTMRMWMPKLRLSGTYVVEDVFQMYALMTHIKRWYGDLYACAPYKNIALVRHRAHPPRWSC